MLAGAHKKFYRIQHPEIYLLDLKVQYKHKMKLPLDMVSKHVICTSASLTTTQIALQRSYHQHSHSNSKSSKLHVFADASPKAYGTVAYLCNKHRTFLVITKSRVLLALKQLTLSQL